MLADDGHPSPSLPFCALPAFLIDLEPLPLICSPFPFCFSFPFCPVEQWRREEREESDFAFPLCALFAFPFISELRHPSILLFLGACLDPPHFCIVTELCLCSLHELLHDPARTVDYAFLIKVMTRRQRFCLFPLSELSLLVFLSFRLRIHHQGNEKGTFTHT